MAYIFTVKEFIEKLKDVEANYRTLYVIGCFGAPMTARNKERYINNGSHSGYNARPERKAKIEAATADTFGFDCVNLIKGLLWGWNGDKNANYGGAKYCANGVPDFGADAVGEYCEDFTADFAGIIPGEALWTNGHVGVYLGNGFAIECTPSWYDRVQITNVGNIRSHKAGYHTRTWRKHGKLKWIDYKQEDETMTEIEKLNKQVKALDEAVLELTKYINEIKPYNVVYHWYSQLPAYARPVIEALHKDGKFAGAGTDDMALPYDVMRTLCVLASNGVFGRKYKKLINPNAEVKK